MITAAEGLQRLLLETLCARADAPADPGGEVDYTPLETAVLGLRWIGEQLSDRGGVALMRSTLADAIEDQAAGPWLRSLADIHWAGIGRWSERPAPLSGPMC